MSAIDLFTTLPETILEVDSGPLEDDFPLPRRGLSTSMIVAGRVMSCELPSGYS